MCSTSTRRAARRCSTCSAARSPPSASCRSAACTTRRALSPAWARTGPRTRTLPGGEIANADFETSSSTLRDDLSLDAARSVDALCPDATAHVHRRRRGQCHLGRRHSGGTLARSSTRPRSAISSPRNGRRRRRHSAAAAPSMDLHLTAADERAAFAAWFER